MNNKPISTFAFTPLTTVSPLDGRYREQLTQLSLYTSEYSLIRNRLEVEVLYLLALSEASIARKVSVKEKKLLTSLFQEFSLRDAETVKSIEKETRHDVKAVEKFLRDSFEKTSLKDLLEKIHFGLTSEDINNIAYRLQLKRATEQVCIPAIKAILNYLIDLSDEYKNTPMLARTHGQPAVPTTLGKELLVFATRLKKELDTLENTKLSGKLNGAVGNYNALAIAYPNVNWPLFSKNFILSFDLEPITITTQINTYEDIIYYLQTYQRINTIILDFDQDMWRYISDDYFFQEIKKSEVGSSTMPQKVNPIFFENSEGNIGLANSLIEFMTRKLGVSRMQRDLSDGTVIRNIGAILGYSLLSYNATLEGLKRVSPNLAKIQSALFADWSILTEGVQTILRQEGIVDSYSLVKSLSRGKHLTENDWKAWIDSLPLDEKIKMRIRTLTPASYTGLASNMTKKTIQELKKKK